MSELCEQCGCVIPNPVVRKLEKNGKEGDHYYCADCANDEVPLPESDARYPMRAPRPHRWKASRSMTMRIGDLKRKKGGKG